MNVETIGYAISGITGVYNSNPEASHDKLHLSKENQQDEANKIVKS